jgi:hypothetical protein
MMMTMMMMMMMTMMTTTMMMILFPLLLSLTIAQAAAAEAGQPRLHHVPGRALRRAEFPAANAPFCEFSSCSSRVVLTKRSVFIHSF